MSDISRSSIRFVAVILLSLISNAAKAEDVLDPPHPALTQIQANLNSCIDRNPGNINEMLCTGEAYREIDTLLNKSYSKIVAYLKRREDPDHDAEVRQEILKRLVASERAWITYREAECSHASAYMFKGSGEQTIRVQCQYSMSRERVNNLFRFYKESVPSIAEN